MQIRRRQNLTSGGRKQYLSRHAASSFWSSYKIPKQIKLKIYIFYENYENFINHRILMYSLDTQREVSQ